MSYKIHLYCFLNDKGAVFLNRKDQVIRQFKTYKEAYNFAKENYELINKTL